MHNLRSIWLASALALCSVPALAGPTYMFNTSFGTQPSNVGVITLTQIDATHVQVGVDLLPGYGFINTGGPHTPFAFNLSGTETGVAISSFTTPPGGNYSNGNAGTFTLNLANGDNTPYGTFGVAIDIACSGAGNCNGSSNGYFGDLLFTLTRPTGLSTDDFSKNVDADCPGGGCYFSADLSNGSNTGAQGWATRSTPNVPEPMTLALLGAGLIGLGTLARRRSMC